MNCRRTAQMAFVLGGFLGKNVALEGLTALDCTTRTHHEALCSTLLGLHLRHDEQLHYLMDMGVRLAQKALYRPSRPTPLGMQRAGTAWLPLFRKSARGTTRCGRISE